jgi:hypothetical protein
MGIFKRLSKIFSPSGGEEQCAYWLYVQCGRCGEKIKARVDLFNDLSPIYEEEGVTYFSRKILIGQERCYQKIEVEMTFDDKRRLTRREIKGGQFLTAEAYHGAVESRAG